MSGRVRGLFAGDAYMALEVCDTRDFDGTLPPSRVVGHFAIVAASLPRQNGRAKPPLHQIDPRP